MTTTTDLRIGSQVLVASGFGAGVLQRGTVIGVYEDIKNGKPGIDYSTTPGQIDHWAYLHQVRKIEKY